MRNKLTHVKKSKDRSLTITIFAFLGFGLLMIANSTVITSNRLYGDPYKFVFLQFGWILMGLVCFYVFCNLDYKKLEQMSRSLFVFNTAALFVLAVVSFFPCSTGFGFAPCINGANRWLYLNPPPLPPIPFLGVLGFQPGELAKLTIILYLSARTSSIVKKEKIKDNKNSLFKVYLMVSVLLSGLIILQPNMSTAAIVFFLGTVIYFTSGAPLKPILITIPVVVVLAVAVILSSPYRKARLASLVSGDDSGESSYHIKQALVALGSGGMTGVGFGQSKQKYQYLPEVASDSIFAIIGEEFGFIGTTVVVIAYLFFIYQGFMIAKRSEDLFGKLVAVGISSWFGLQFFINVAAMTKIIPLTGVPIPLISYGGSSMVFSLMGLGILANISENSRL